LPEEPDDKDKDFNEMQEGGSSTPYKNMMEILRNNQSENSDCNDEDNRFSLSVDKNEFFEIQMANFDNTNEEDTDR
jgi:hypothetical protein